MTEPPHRRGQDHDGLLDRPDAVSETPRLDTFDFDRDGECERDDRGFGDWMRTDDVRALFTAEDVAFLRDMQAQAIRGRGGVQAHRFGRIADRIEALLPPA